MSEPTPEPGGVIARIEQWVEAHVAPELGAAKADLERLLKFAEANAANGQAAANVILMLVKLVAPADMPATAALIEEAEKVAAEAVRIGEELLGKM